MESAQQAWPLPTRDLKPALELALAVAHGDMGVLLLQDDVVGALLPVLGVGLDSDQWAAFGTHHAGVGPFGRALSTHRRVTVRDAWRGPGALPELAKRLGYRGIEILPLFGPDDHAIGALGVMFRRGRGNHRRTHRLVDRCAQLVVTAVLQAQRYSVSEQAREVAEQSGRARMKFLAHMSHELRTPLQSIAGYLDLLRMDTADPLTPSQAHQVERMRASEEILVHVIDDLITFSQLESGHVTFRLGPTDAGDALRVAEAVVVPLAIDRGVRLELMPTLDDVMVNADPDKLKQVLINLTANAVKFTQRGGVVTLAFRLDAGAAYIDVADTGPGIAADKLVSIFEPYVQLGTPLLDRFGGSGLGLAISREFAVGMLGYLTVKSVIGCGSTFTLCLPRLLADGATLPTPARARFSAEPANAANMPGR